MRRVYIHMYSMRRSSGRYAPSRAGPSARFECRGHLMLHKAGLHFLNLGAQHESAVALADASNLRRGRV